MTAFLRSHAVTMDVSQIDDKMEMGTSPYAHVDDIDFEFEQTRQPSADRSMVDETEVDGKDIDIMQADTSHVYNDDDMLDEDTIQPSLDDITKQEDLNMEFHDDRNVQDQDDEILYDDDEDEEEKEKTGFVDMAGQEPQETLDTSGVDAHDNDFQLDISNQVTVLPNEDNYLDQPTNADEKAAIQDGEYQEESAIENEDPQVGLNTTDNLPNETEVVDFAAQNELSQHDKDVDTHTQAVAPLESLSESVDRSSGDHQTRDEEATSQAITAEQNISTEIVNEDMNAKSSSHLETESSLHPVTVLYLGQEMSLFPPMIDDASATFFVSETSLAYEPIEKLLASCREILGETLEHEDELVFDVPTLGLHICEDSKYASQITLSQIIDVYLHLSHNENVEDIEPLNCNLSSRVCLASQYAYLASSASEGKTYSEIAVDYVESPEHEAEILQEEFGGEQFQEVTQADNASHDLEYTGVAETQATEDGAEQTTLNSGHDKPAGSGTPKTQYESVSQGNKENEEHSDAPDVDQTEFLNLPQDSKLNAATSPQPPDGQIEVNDTTDLEEHDHGFAQAEDVKDDDAASDSSHTIEGEADEELAEQLFLTEESITETGLGLPDGGPNSADNDEKLDFENESNNENEVDHILNGPEDEANAVSAPEMDDVNGHADEKLLNDEVDYEELAFDDEDEEQVGGNENDEDTDQVDILQTEDVPADAPVTPSKQNGSKRKAPVEEDDFDILDLSTPEPKRNRAQ